MPYFDTPNWCQTKFYGKPEISWCGYNKTFNLDPKYSPSQDIYVVGYPSSQIPFMHQILKKFVTFLSYFILILFVVTKIITRKNSRTAFVRQIIILSLLVILIVKETFWSIFNFQGNWFIEISSFFVIMIQLRALREAWKKIILVILQSLPIMSIIIMYIIYFSTIAHIWFTRNPWYNDPNGYFDTLQSSLFNTYVLFTTSNFPDIIIPFWKTSNLTGIFFLLFLVLSLYIMLNLMLAVMVLSYQKLIEKKLAINDEIRNQFIINEFNSLKDQDQDYIRLNIFEQKYHQQIKEWSHLDKLIKQIKEEKRLTIADDKIILADFGYMYLLLEPEEQQNIPGISLPFFKKQEEVGSKKNKDDNEETLCQIYTKFICQFFCKDQFIGWQKGNYTGFFMAAISIVNLTAIPIMNQGIHKDGLVSKNTYKVVKLQFYLQLLYLIDLLITARILGFKNTIQSQYVGLSAKIEILAPILHLLQFGNWIKVLNQKPMSDESFYNVLSILILIRLAKIIQFLEELEQLNFVIKTLSIMFRPFIDLLFTLYSIYFIYAIIGVEIYGGKISGNVYQELNQLNPGIIPSDFVWLTFNDFYSALMVLFSIQIFNEWQSIWMVFTFSIDGRQLISNFYFLSFILIVNYAVLNILMAFVIDVYSKITDIYQKEQKERQKIIQLGKKEMESKELSQ